MPLWGILLSFFTAALWAASPILIDRGLACSRCTVREINPFRAASFLVCSFVIALAVTHGHIAPIYSLKGWLYIIVGIVFSYSLGDIIYFAAIREIGVSMAVPVANGYPVLAIFTSAMMLGEPVTAQLIFGVVIVVGGILLIRFGGAASADTGIAKRSGRTLLKGFSFAILAGVMWSISAPLIKVAMVETRLAPVEITFYRSLSFIFVAAAERFVLVRSKVPTVPLARLPRRSVVCFLSAGCVGLSLGSICYATCLHSMPVAAVTAITATSPFIAALFGHFVLKDRLAVPQWLGVLCIISGSVVIGI
ncbi:MAG: DMT family transporter [Synergistes sp.]|nr:DMT family transporter [Synergistes sp.]